MAVIFIVKNMSIFELTIVSIGLAMDAFAVSISKGLAIRELRWRQAAWAGLWFGGFQALMPLLGFFVGSRFSESIKAVDHWVAFVLLLIVGLNMIREAIAEKKADADSTEDSEKEELTSSDLGVRTMLVLAVATSVDALAVGITFALLKVNMLVAVSMIGVITFAISAAGVYLGHAVGAKFKKSASLLGGVVLVGIGIKILLEHLGILV